METLNDGGTSTVEQLLKLIALWPQPTVVVVALTEIRLSQNASIWEYQTEVQKASHGDWWFTTFREPIGKNWRGSVTGAVPNFTGSRSL